MSLNHYVDKRVCIITTTGRTIVGTLVGYDNQTNLILNDTVERQIASPDDDFPSSEIPMGVYLIRGDDVCLVGLVDEALDKSINWEEVKGAKIGSTKHS
ncbi:hypothetical protein B0H63DRAFT_57832 [Podospora didyma]|uniref:LSM2-LSM8 complex subunit LSM8 n=1 Tax=Podospora didyma TaxID=330526 RepID=A0AAE0P7K0_9PEZI|nr:hypothetical protein B0H63DRAFT_57832 [Podospora didyma]